MYCASGIFLATFNFSASSSEADFTQMSKVVSTISIAKWWFGNLIIEQEEKEGRGGLGDPMKAALGDRADPRSALQRQEEKCEFTIVTV